MKYFVSRQCYWGLEQDSFIVEISIGGRDLAGPDMLTPYWKEHGEGKEFKNPIEAAEAAIDIKKLWRESGQKDAQLGYVCTGGFTIPAEPCSDESLMQWAQLTYSKLEKCEQCKDILPSSKERWGNQCNDDYVFCSQACADKDEQWHYDQERKND